jgi:hypothetical protein
MRLYGEQRDGSSDNMMSCVSIVDDDGNRLCESLSVVDAFACCLMPRCKLAGGGANKRGHPPRYKIRTSVASAIGQHWDAKHTLEKGSQPLDPMYFSALATAAVAQSTTSQAIAAAAQPATPVFTIMYTPNGRPGREVYNSQEDEAKASISFALATFNRLKKNGISASSDNSDEPPKGELAFYTNGKRKESAQLKRPAKKRRREEAA